MLVFHEENSVLYATSYSHNLFVRKGLYESGFEDYRDKVFKKVRVGLHTLMEVFGRQSYLVFCLFLLFRFLVFTLYHI